MRDHEDKPDSEAPSGAASVVWETSLTQTGVQRFLRESREFGVGIDKIFGTPTSQRIDLRPQFK
jgi:hypothetical protein